MEEEVPPGAPTDDRAGPAFPAELMNITPCLFTTCSSGSGFPSLVQDHAGSRLQATGLMKSWTLCNVEFPNAAGGISHVQSMSGQTEHLLNEAFIAGEVCLISFRSISIQGSAHMMFSDHIPITILQLSIIKRMVPCVFYQQAQPRITANQI